MTTENPEKSRKLKCIYINPNIILTLFQRPIDKFANFFYLDGIPKNIKVINVYYDYSWAAFCFIVEHESFQPVKLGEQIPILSEIFTITLVKEPGYEQIKS